MRRLIGAVALALAVIAGGIAALAVTGGGSSPTSAAARSASADQRAAIALRNLARCVRAHGLPNFPDPLVRSDGVPQFPDSAPRVPTATQQACRAVAGRIPPEYTVTTATPVSDAEFQRLLGLARCIRAHGVSDWPDPNALGQFPIDVRIQEGGKQVVLPALEACARLNPNPRGGLNVVRSHTAP
jgi:hypothetical protein